MNNKTKWEWPWNVPVSDFEKLGDEKFYWLCRYASSVPNSWCNEGKFVHIDELLDMISRDRRFASQMYIGFSDKIKSFMKYHMHEAYPLRVPSSHPVKPSYSPTDDEISFLDRAYTAALENDKVAQVVEAHHLKKGYVQLIGIIMLKGEKGKKLTISQANLAKLLLTDVAMAGHALRELERKGLISRTKQAGKPSIIDLLILGEGYEYKAACVNLAAVKSKKRTKSNSLYAKAAKILQFKTK